MLHSSTHPVARRTARAHSHHLTTPMLFRAPARGGARRSDTQLPEDRRPLDTHDRSLIAAASRLISEGRNEAGRRTGGFTTSVIDRLPALLRNSYRLRHQVYCLERQFLAAADYPDGLERDEFDASSVHVGAVDTCGTLAGTARLILPLQNRLPTLEYCSFPATGGGPLWNAKARWVEASRLSVSRSYGAAVRATDGTMQAGTNDRGPVFLAILMGLYHASRRLEATHWLVSIEPSLQRLLARAGFPFRQLGPGFDYLGTVAAYSMDLREFEEVVASGRYPALVDFLAGCAPRSRTPPAPETSGSGRVAGSSIDQLPLAG